MKRDVWTRSTDPRALLEAATVKPGADRKTRLVAVACAARLRPDTPAGHLQLAARLADDPGVEPERKALFQTLPWNGPPVSRALLNWSGFQAGFQTLSALGVGAYPPARRVSPADVAACCAVIRDVFPDPTRPVAVAPDWRTTSAVALARQMYDTGDFSAVPILADALEEAGCGVAAVLDHCRGPGPHVRGCWVVDAVLGKE